KERVKRQGIRKLVRCRRFSRITQYRRGHKSLFLWRVSNYHRGCEDHRLRLTPAPGLLIRNLFHPPSLRRGLRKSVRSLDTVWTKTAGVICEKLLTSLHLCRSRERKWERCSMSPKEA